MPTAKPTGQRLGPGTCGCSRLGSKSVYCSEIQACATPSVNVVTADAQL